MISGPVAFEEIVQSVKDETGIENLRPYYDQIRRLIFRAERDIGYGGSVIIKKFCYRLDVNNFNGLYVKYPEDFIEFEGLGTSETGAFPSCDYNHTFDGSGIRLRKKQNKVTMLYWGLACDGYGNPITTRNHEDAVVAYIVWKLYARRRFTDKGNANTAIDYKEHWISECLAARGDDAFPTLEQYNEIGMLSYADRRGLLQFPTASYTYCDESILGDCNCNDDTPPVSAPKVYYWQLEFSETIQDIQQELNQDYLDAKPSLPLTTFNEGHTVIYNNVGKIAFAISKTQSQNFTIRDILNNDVTKVFTSFYDINTQSMVYVSNSRYTTSNIFFKIQDNG